MILVAIPVNDTAQLTFHTDIYSRPNKGTSGIDWKWCLCVHKIDSFVVFLQGRCHLQWTEDFVTSMLFHHVRHHLQGRCHLQWTEDFVMSMLFHHIIFWADVTFNGLKILSQVCFFITSSSGKMSPSMY